MAIVEAKKSQATSEIHSRDSKLKSPRTINLGNPTANPEMASSTQAGMLPHSTEAGTITTIPIAPLSLIQE